jgi:hypothetical protein
MRDRLRTLLIVLALGPPMLAGAWWIAEPYIIRRPASERLRQIGLAMQNYSGDSIWLKLPDGRPAYMAGIPLRQHPDDSADD